MSDLAHNINVEQVLDTVAVVGSISPEDSTGYIDEAVVQHEDTAPFLLGIHMAFDAMSHQTGWNKWSLASIVAINRPNNEILRALDTDTISHANQAAWLMGLVVTKSVNADVTPRADSIRRLAPSVDWHFAFKLARQQSARSALLVVKDALIFAHGSTAPVSRAFESGIIDLIACDDEGTAIHAAHDKILGFL